MSVNVEERRRLAALCGARGGAGNVREYLMVLIKYTTPRSPISRWADGVWQNEPREKEVYHIIADKLEMLASCTCCMRD
jgi:uncharacterized protein YozE (UPF0346 family)